MFEIVIYDALRIVSGNSEPLRQSECGYAVDDAEIGCLGYASLLGSDLVQSNTENLGRRHRVNVLVGAEGFHKVAVAAQVGHNPEFNLGVVSGNDDPVGSGWHKCASDFLASLRSHRYVLQVRPD